MRCQKWILTFLIGLISLSESISQSKPEQTIWLEVSETASIGPRVSVLLLFQNRQFLNRRSTYQNLYWLSADYKVGNLSIGGGMMYFEYHKLLASTYKSVPEVRPFQFVRFQVSGTRWNFHLRAMMEERYMSDVEKNEIYDMNHLEIRFRFRTNTSYKLNSKLSLALGNEVFFYKENGFIQNRAIAELRLKLRSVRLSAGYMNWYLKELPIRHSWLIRFNHRISVKN